MRDDHGINSGFGKVIDDVVCPVDPVEDLTGLHVLAAFEWKLPEDQPGDDPATNVVPCDVFNHVLENGFYRPPLTEEQRVLGHPDLDIPSAPGEHPNFYTVWGADGYPLAILLGEFTHVEAMRQQHAVGDFKRYVLDLVTKTNGIPNPWDKVFSVPTWWHPDYAVAAIEWVPPRGWDFPVNEFNIVYRGLYRNGIQPKFVPVYDEDRNWQQIGIVVEAEIRDFPDFTDFARYYRRLYDALLALPSSTFRPWNQEKLA